MLKKNIQQVNIGFWNKNGTISGKHTSLSKNAIQLMFNIQHSGTKTARLQLNIILIQSIQLNRKNVTIGIWNQNRMNLGKYKMLHFCNSQVSCQHKFRIYHQLQG